MEDAICYELRVIPITTGTSVKGCSLKSFLSFKVSLDLSFRTPTCCKDYSRLLFSQRLARDPRPAASKDEPLMRTQATWNSLPQTDIQNLFDSLPRRIAALIEACGGYTKY
ncbi:uncharacterized protein TNCV_5112991 [Trichonephila clavipes]|nr:uncharacterized protein TNCV_5112991 [Trichonephila clavipes]